MAQSYYFAVFVSESRRRSDEYAQAPVDESDPLFEESFVLLAAGSFEEAVAKARSRPPEPTYKNQYGETVTWSRRLVEVGEALSQTFEDTEVYARFFRNGRAYEQLEFESFEKCGGTL